MVINVSPSKMITVKPGIPNLYFYLILEKLEKNLSKNFVFNVYPVSSLMKGVILLNNHI